MERKGRGLRLAALAAGLGVIAAGAVFRLAPPPVRPSPPPSPVVVAAHLTAYEGTVHVKRRGTVEWVAAARAMALGTGDFVRTDPRAAAEITYADGFVVHVHPETLLTILPVAEEGRKADLRAGTIVGDAIGGGSSSIITTPEARWEGAGGGDPPLVGLQALSAGGTTIDQRRGQARIVPRGGGARVVGPQTRIAVDAQGRPGPTIALPPAPILLSPPTATRLAYPDIVRGVTRLAWSSVPEAASYRLLVDHGGFFLQPIVDRTALRQTTWELTGIPEGSYYWKVAAVSVDGAESFSEFARFTVAPAERAPTLVVETFETQGNVLHVTGRTDPGTTVSVNGQPVEVHANGTFDEFVALPRTGAQAVSIQAVGRGGKVTGVTRDTRSP